MKDKVIKAIIKNMRLIVLALIAIVMWATASIMWSIISYNAGYNQGFDACIEENNLYERYERSK